MDKANEIWAEIQDSIFLLGRKGATNEWEQKWKSVVEYEYDFFGWAFDYLPDSAGVVLKVLPDEIVSLLAEHCGGDVKGWWNLREDWKSYYLHFYYEATNAKDIQEDFRELLWGFEDCVDMDLIMSAEIARHMQRGIASALFQVGQRRQLLHSGLQLANVAWLKRRRCHVSNEAMKVCLLALEAYGDMLWEKLKVVWEEIRSVVDGSVMQLQASFMMLQTVENQTSGAVASNELTDEEAEAILKQNRLRSLYEKLNKDGWLQEEPKQTEEEFANVILNNSGDLWFCGGNSELACLIDALTASNYLPGFSEIEIAFFIADKKGAKVQPFTVEMYNTGRKSPRRPTEKNSANAQTKMPKILDTIGTKLREPERIRKRKKELAEYNAAQRKEPFDWSGRRSSHPV